MFDVLIYLFENLEYSGAEICIDQDTLADELTDAGFERNDIYNALNWLEKLTDYQKDHISPVFFGHDPLSMRIYTWEECQRLDSRCRGFILFLEQIKILNLKTREMVLERVMALDTPDIDLDSLKWLVLLVLFNVPGCEMAYQQVENLFFNVPKGMLH